MMTSESVAIREKRRTRRTLLKESITDGGGDVEEEMETLEEQMNSELSNIARMVEMKYKDCLSTFTIASTLMDAIEVCNKKTDYLLGHIGNKLNRIQEDLRLENVDAGERLEAIKMCKEKMKRLAKIEKSLMQLDTSDDLLLNACLLQEIESDISVIQKGEDETEGLFAQRIIPNLRIAIFSQHADISYHLNEFWKNFIKVTGNESKAVTITIIIHDPNEVSKMLSAMKVLNELDDKLAKLCSRIMHDFCTPIISCSNQSKISFIFDDEKHQYIMKRDLESPDDKKVDYSKIFSNLADFFGRLHGDFGKVEVGGVRLTSMLGKKISAELIDTVTRDCLSVAVPYDTDHSSDFDSLLETAEGFHAEMKAMGFFDESVSSFKDFSENYSFVFVNRRCARIFAEARELITKPYSDLVMVGVENDDKEETPDEFSRVAYSPASSCLLGNQKYPKILQLSRCQVSKSTVDLVSLIMETVKYSAEAESELVTVRLFETARNIVQMFSITAPRVHKVPISTVPLIAAVFYNNCYYLCHCIMSIALDRQLAVAVAANWNELHATFAHFVPMLRELAAECLEQQLAQCRRQLSTILCDDQMFSDLDDVSSLRSCEKTLKACVFHLKQVAEIWKEVMTSTVFAKSLGNLASFFFESVFQIIVAQEDIKASDSEKTVLLLKEAVQSVESLLIIGSRSFVHLFSEKEYYRINELLFCLSGSLRDIWDRWCDGKGPLAQWMKPLEIRQLIKALFQNTDKRAAVLAKIA
ncbi:hypothetical protein AB6A40_004885 [Gnathostoma spinigerum]|uniref:Centromere/kinetochore protein zw10-like protein n=1 Tax=Gnathostoma spinigerum TaxID=75299 RepID=A0ABD6EL85_9BILA